jgi:hypothetical protein
MAAKKMVYISARAHQRLKLLAAHKQRAMGEVVEALIEEELSELANPWTSPAGLLAQQAALGAVWEDPALDVYDDD